MDNRRRDLFYPTGTVCFHGLGSVRGACGRISPHGGACTEPWERGRPARILISGGSAPVRAGHKRSQDALRRGVPGENPTAHLPPRRPQWAAPAPAPGPSRRCPDMTRCRPAASPAPSAAGKVYSRPVALPQERHDPRLDLPKSPGLAESADGRLRGCGELRHVRRGWPHPAGPGAPRPGKGGVCRIGRAGGFRDGPRQSGALAAPRRTDGPASCSPRHEPAAPARSAPRGNARRGARAAANGYPPIAGVQGDGGGPLLCRDSG